MYIVYHIKNTINSKGYVGYSGRTLEQRWKSHISAGKRPSCRFHFAIRKYGPDPWIKDILGEFENIQEAKNFEILKISEFGYMDSKKGYNAKPGGCGGFIVPPEKYESWKAKLKKLNKGIGNPNAYDISNERILELGLMFCDRYNNLPHKLQEFIDFAKQYDQQIPTVFHKYRFGGYREFLGILSDQTGMIRRKKNYKSEEHRKKSSEANKGFHWYTCEELKKSVQCKDETKLDKQYSWIRGRKYGARRIS
jgi:hypothetical protein